MVHGRGLKAAPLRKPRPRPRGGGTATTPGTVSAQLAAAINATRAATAQMSTSVSSGVPTTLEQDWNARATIGVNGVVQAIRFTSPPNALNYRHISNPSDGTELNVSFDASDGIIGDGCLRINVPRTAGANCGSWRAPLNASWTNDATAGIGTTPYYIQYRVKLGPNRMTESNGGGGFKIMNLAEYKLSSPNSSSSNTNFEVVVNNQNWRQSLFAYHNPAFEGFYESINGEIRLQPALDRGASAGADRFRYCLYESGNSSPGCWFYEEETWFTVYIRLHIATLGGTAGNEFDLWVAREGESSYTQLYASRDFQLSQDPTVGPNGTSGIWFLPYDTARNNANYDTYHKYDQFIASTQPIACPQPLISVPTWYTAQTEKTWVTPVANTLQDVYVQGTAGLPASGLYAWSSGVAHRDRKALRFFGGGHTDNDVNSLFEVRLASSNPVWTRLSNPSVNTGGSAASGVYGDGQPRSSHSWRHLVDVPNSGTWMAPLPGTYVTGANSGRCFSFSDSTSTWTAKGYRPGTDASTGLGDSNTLGSSDYDPVTGLIFITASEGPIWTINPLTGVAALRTGVNNTNYYFVSGLSPERRCLVIWRPDTAQFRVYDLDGDVMYSPALSGSGPNGSMPGIVWHSASGGFLVWGNTSGTANIYKLIPPSIGNTFTGTWTWTTVTPHASNSIVPNAATGGSTQPTLKIIGNFGGGGRDLLVLYGASPTSPVWCYKLPIGGV